MKKVIVGFLAVFVVISMLTSCTATPVKEIKEEDAIKFKEEYESLNDKSLEVSIPEDNKIKYASFDDIMSLLTDGTGVIYFGFPSCPWCRNMIPILLNSAADTDLENILYFNALDIRDSKHLDDNGNIITDKEGTEEYYQLLDKLTDVLGSYEGLNDPSIKRLYFPTVIFVKKGEIVGTHIGTVDSQTDPTIKLNKQQSDELYQIYIENMQKVLGILCDDEKLC